MKKSTPTASSATPDDGPRCQYHWTQEAEDRLLELIEKERVTAARAAAILNRELPGRTLLTKSAVLGKIHRLWKGTQNEQ